VEFMVELYAPASTLGSDARAAEDAARSLRDEGLAVWYLRSIVIPDDETCFHVFEAPSLEAVREVARRATVRFERIVPVIEVQPLRSPIGSRVDRSEG
jgi:Nickel responsive protein SCO4226-like